VRERDREKTTCLYRILDASAIGRMPEVGMLRVWSDGTGGIFDGNNDPDVGIALIEAPGVVLSEE
jgi:hypothetical protein